MGIGRYPKFKKLATKSLMHERTRSRRLSEDPNHFSQDPHHCLQVNWYA